MTLMTRILLLTALSGSLFACSKEMGLASANPADTDADFDMEASDDTAAPDGDASENVNADLASLEGMLTISDGNIVAEQSSLQITLFAGDVELCTADIVVQASELSVVDDPSVTTSSWWTLALAQSDTAAALDCDAPVPTTLGLGAAPYDAQLAPAADDAGFEDDGSALYSALAQFGAGEAVYLFGVLGTDAQFDGTAAGDPATQAEDGMYTLSTLYLLPLSAVQ
ncbi:MAG: hypothetical protein ACJAZO_001834 [Myxococcota bacterium]|jgi:hypothetical protein